MLDGHDVIYVRGYSYRFVADRAATPEPHEGRDEVIEGLTTRRKTEGEGDVEE